MAQRRPDRMTDDELLTQRIVLDIEPTPQYDTMSVCRSCQGTFT
jgi:hypothetical protein